METVFEKATTVATAVSGNSITFLLALGMVLFWLLSCAAVGFVQTGGAFKIPKNRCAIKLPKENPEIEGQAEETAKNL